MICSANWSHEFKNLLSNKHLIWATDKWSFLHYEARAHLWYMDVLRYGYNNGENPRKAHFYFLNGPLWVGQVTLIIYFSILHIVSHVF